MSVTDLTVKSERLPGPMPANRRCRCGAKLSTYNEGNSCAPCNGGEWEIPEPSDREVIELQRARFEELGAAA